MANGQFFSGLVRLYHATLNRSADHESLGYWVSQLAKGDDEFTFIDLAEVIMDSEEFKTLYDELPDDSYDDDGSLTDEAFVTLLFNNILKRAPDSEGMGYWLKVLNKGTLRSHVLLALSDSDEHIEHIENEFQDELAEAEQEEIRVSAENNSDDEEDDSEDEESSDEDESDDEDLNDEPSEDGDLSSDEDDHHTLQTHSDEDSISLLYDAAFDHSPDEHGHGHWVSALAKSDISLEDIAEAFMASDEYQAAYGDDQTDDDFIKSLYENILGREADADGKDYWFGKLVSGAAKGDVLVEFSESEEHFTIVIVGLNDTTPTSDAGDIL